MKKLFFGSIVIALCAVIYGAMEVKEVAKDWLTTATSVSSTTVTAIPSANLSGRYKIVIENTNGTFDMSIGTFSSLTYAAGFIVHPSSGFAENSITLPLGSGTTVYGLAQASSANATVNVRAIEFK